MTDLGSDAAHIRGGDAERALERSLGIVIALAVVLYFFRNTSPARPAA